MKTIITVVRDFDMYNKCIGHNQNCANMKHVFLNNRNSNRPIPVLYNEFIDKYEYVNESWFIFCHEDFELLQTVEFQDLRKDALYGVVGCKRKGVLGFEKQVFCGCIEECKRHGDGSKWIVGNAVFEPTEVDTFDCCCLIVHSSLVKRYRLRFDENLAFDLYVEDFCATSKLENGICSYVIPIKACHHSGSVPTERLYRHLPYLREKYPNNFFVGTCTYFGTFTKRKRLQDFIVKIGRIIMGNR